MLFLTNLRRIKFIACRIVCCNSACASKFIRYVDGGMVLALAAAYAVAGKIADLTAIPSS